MGTLRLLLAICVVLTHTAPIGFAVGVTGGTAVQCFYIVSGFFMAMILTEKYNRRDQIWLFYSNRFLRVFSVYWFFLVLSFGLSAVNYLFHHTGTLARWGEYWGRLTSIDAIGLVLSNIFIFGHDWASFTQLTMNGIAPVADPHHLSPLVPTFFFVPQAWTLGVEVCFYVLAPFLVRRRAWVLALIVLATVMLRFDLLRHGLSHSAWFNGFFPMEVGMFLLGSLSYKAYARYKTALRATPWVKVAFLLFPFLLFFQHIDPHMDTFFSTGYLALYLSIAVAIPGLFVATSRNRWDRAVGEWSYPIYLSHEMFISTLGRVHFLAVRPISQACLVIAATCLFSALTVKYLDLPINRYREARVRRAARHLPVQVAA